MATNGMTMMSDYSLYKVTRQTTFVDINGDEHVLITHTVTAGGSSRSEAIEAGKDIMYPQVTTNWDADEFTEDEYKQHFNEIDVKESTTVTGRLHR
jgi:hypothetical protein